MSTQESPIAKDIRYNLARGYESSGKNDKALEIYRKLARQTFLIKMSANVLTIEVIKA